jgi:hypothetical protein
MITVVLDVSGGVVQAVYSDHSDVRVIKVDWDVGESPGDEVKAGDLLVDPAEAMPDETRAAVAAIH